MDKLWLTGRALGRVFNFKGGCMHHSMHLRPGVAKQPNLELKTRPKQLLGSLLLVIPFPSYPHKKLPRNRISLCQLVFYYNSNNQTNKAGGKSHSSVYLSQMSIGSPYDR
jgi:hypothetical protein